MNRLAVLSLISIIFLGGCITPKSYSQIILEITEESLGDWDLISPPIDNSEFRHPTLGDSFLSGANAHFKQGLDQLEILFMEFDNPEAPQQIIGEIMATSTSKYSAIVPLPEECLGLSEQMGRMGSLETGQPTETIDVQNVYCVNGNLLTYIKSTAPPGTVSMNDLAAAVLKHVSGD